MNRIEITVDGADIIMDGHRLDLAAAEGLRAILDECIRRIGANARAAEEREHAAQRKRDEEGHRAKALAVVDVPWRADVLLLRADGRAVWLSEAIRGRRSSCRLGRGEQEIRELAAKVPERRLWWIGDGNRCSHLDGCGCWVPERSAAVAWIMPADWRPMSPCSRSVKRLGRSS